jgi:hypothetical protein
VIWGIVLVIFIVIVGYAGYRIGKEDKFVVQENKKSDLEVVGEIIEMVDRKGIVHQEWVDMINRVWPEYGLKGMEDMIKIDRYRLDKLIAYYDIWRKGK